MDGNSGGAGSYSTENQQVDRSTRRRAMIEGNYYKGFLRFYLNGTKLKGEWTLQRDGNRKDERDKREKWYLSKTTKNTRTVSKKRDDESALTKRTMTQIASAADAVWQGNRR